MIDDETFERCRPLLEDENLDDEERTEKLEALLKPELSGAALENTVLDALWRHRNGKSAAESILFRGTILRKQSPAPWQARAPSPLASPPPGSSPVLYLASSGPRPSFSRQRSTAPSPFASPRPSPHLAFAQPIPHSPSLNAYEFSEDSPAPDIYGDYGSDNVDWLVGDETASNASSTGTGTLSAAAPEWTPQNDMGPHDILRSVLGDRKTNEEIDEALEQTSYDLAQTIALLSDASPSDSRSANGSTPSLGSSVLIGKSMSTEIIRPVTPNTGKSSIVCKYWLASGSCLRADCRFAHDTSSHVCK